MMTQTLGSLLGLHGVEGLVPRLLQTSSLQMMLPLLLIPLKGQNYSWTALSVGLAMNDTKTKFMTLNMTEEASSLVSWSSGNQLEKVTDFVYLGAWIATTERDLRVRKAKALAACHKLKKMEV